MIDIFTGYSWGIAALQFGLAVLLFFIINWIGAHSISVGYQQMDIVISEESAPAFNLLFKVISPVVFLILSAVICQELGLSILNTNCYFIVVFYWGFRFLWVLCTNRGSLTNWWEQLLYCGCSIALSVWVYSLIESVDKILPSATSLLEQLWILIIIFIYNTLNKLEYAKAGTIKRKNNYIISRYRKFRKKYGNQITNYFHNDTYEAITYAIMIYEDFNRPKIIRCFEYIRFYVTQKTHTLGIMQVTTNKWINDQESLSLAMEKIKHSGEKYISLYKNHEYRYYYDSPNNMAEFIASDYNTGNCYASQIRDVMDCIRDTFYKGYLPSLFPPPSESPLTDEKPMTPNE